MSMQSPTLLGPEEGDLYQFLAARNRILAGGKQTEGTMTIIEFEAPPGFGPPPHIHHREDEAFYVLEGSALFHCDGDEVTYEAGGFCYLPKGLVHRFEMGPDGGRILQITTPSQFEEMVADYGYRIGREERPEPEEPDIPRLVEVCQRYGIDLLLGGPPS